MQLQANINQMKLYRMLIFRLKGIDHLSWAHLIETSYTFMESTIRFTLKLAVCEELFLEKSSKAGCSYGVLGMGNFDFYGLNSEEKIFQNPFHPG